ncbi:MAG: DUF2058 family protein [Pseudomonadota bacterium]|nr:DUF2058 family protein [Pseudomonadota bacterium]MDQ3229628.1 DUF2058 family protein [Pseudomonadota bacterium]
MSDSLRDQLLGLGFKSMPKPAAKPQPQSKPGAKSGPNARNERRPERPHAGYPHPQHARPPRADRPQRGPAPTRTREEIDLAKAYAIRAQKEKDERIEAERIKQEDARLRREAKAKLTEMLKNKALNDPAADIARHFDYGGKIKRVHVNELQLRALNAGELGVVQLDGRYLLVTAATLAEAEAIFLPALALKVDPNASAGDDPYADPQYQVPDDLVW